jgi:hypothetical protein
MIECKFGIESALSIFTITWISAFEPGSQDTLSRQSQNNSYIFFMKYGINITSEIILQFMHNLSIFDERNSIVVNLIFHSKLNIIPILICKLGK